MTERLDRDPRRYLPLPVPQFKQRGWALCSNEEFEGALQDGPNEPRPNGSFAAINTGRHRVQRIVADFKLEKSEPHPKNKGWQAVLPTGRTKSLAWAGLVGLVGRALMPDVV